MKKLLLSLTLLLVIPQAEALSPGIIYKNDPYCGLFGGACPQTFMYNRTGQKALARYNPTGKNYCNSAAMNVWIMGHPNNAYGIGFSTEDWQDLEIAKQKTGGYYRWGCCYTGDPVTKTCLQ